ncbi:unnamed protein product [Ambrosiozyma monospora]|uniref:Unnamed protein product n=1 Tax=Ambrosiozyma monospora TaxID=43982 RepID=A0A9W6T5V6_AMBMO|nr:unnamed protein product [Ambrosiozyma monospora]
MDFHSFTLKHFQFTGNPNYDEPLNSALSYTLTTLQFLQDAYIQFNTNYPSICSVVKIIIVLYIISKIFSSVFRSIMNTIVGTIKLIVFLLLIYEFARIYYGEQKTQLMLADLKTVEYVVMVVYRYVYKIVFDLMSGDLRNAEEILGELSQKFIDTQYQFKQYEQNQF